MTNHFYLPGLFHWLLLSSFIILTSCSDDDPVGPVIPPPGQDGYFIVNEGLFNGANTTLSYYDRERDTVLNNVFETNVGRPLGDQTQSVTVFDERGFLVVQNSGKVEVIHRDDFSAIATISEEITSPRYFLGVDATKGYVTDWGADGVSGTVKVVDLTTYEVTKTIPVGQGPDQLVLLEGQVYVANSGGFGQDSTVMILDPQADAVIDTVVVGVNPSSLTVAASKTIWIASGGTVVYNADFSAIDEMASTPGYIAQLRDGALLEKWDVDKVNAGPVGIAANPMGTRLYYRYDGGIHAVSSGANSLSSTPIVTSNQRIYGLAVDPVSEEILTGTLPNFNDDGMFSRYSTDGTLIKSYTVGIAPNGFAF